MKWRRHLANVGKIINPQKCCGEKLELTNHLKMSRCRWEAYIKMAARKVGCNGVDCAEVSRMKYRDFLNEATIFLFY